MWIVPVSFFFDHHLSAAALDAITHLFRLFAVALPITLLFLIGCGVARAMAKPLPSRLVTLQLCAWAATLAVASELIVKRIVGRLGPPSYLYGHWHYGFHPLRGAAEDSLPSGTAIIACSITTVLWIRGSRWRALAACGALLLCALVILVTYHWVGDVVAGIWLGAFLGWITLQLLSAPQP